MKDINKHYVSTLDEHFAKFDDHLAEQRAFQRHSLQLGQRLAWVRHQLSFAERAATVQVTRTSKKRKVQAAAVQKVCQLVQGLGGPLQNSLVEQHLGPVRRRQVVYVRQEVDALGHQSLKLLPLKIHSWKRFDQGSVELVHQEGGDCVVVADHIG